MSTGWLRCRLTSSLKSGEPSAIGAFLHHQFSGEVSFQLGAFRRFELQMPISKDASMDWLLCETADTFLWDLEPWMPW